MSSELEDKLAQLKRLHEQGLLTEATYQQQQQALVSGAMGTGPQAASSALAGATRVEAPVESPLRSPLSGPTVVDAHGGLPARLGSYRVLGVIGAGGMGTVLRARHDNAGWARRQGGEVALKLIHPHIAADPAFQERFLDEAELGRRVQHPGLARVYDVVTEGPWLGTVLELIEGEELTARVRPGGLSMQAVLALLRPLAAALDHLHGQGIVHRDLKPANVKLRSDGQPVLLDLGIAKDLSGLGPGQTKTMTAMGTSAWMAPEQADARTVTAAADVYAFGLLAYALRSGRLPWGAEETDYRVMASKLTGRLVPLAEAAPGVPAGVSAAVMAALAVEPQERPSSCGALVRALEAAEREARAAEQRARAETAAERARLQEATEALVAEAAQAGFRLRVPDRLSSGWLGKAREVVAARIAARAAREWEEVQVDASSTVLDDVGLRDLFAMWDQTTFRLRRVPAGVYTVGSRDEDATADSDERPRHAVRFSRAFGIGEWAVTQELWEVVYGRGDLLPSQGRGPVAVSWFEAVTFCNRLSELRGLAAAYRIDGEEVHCDFEAAGFRLPTEHEWEVAARAGTELTYAGSDYAPAVAWLRSLDGGPHPVGTKLPNAWGLHDMSGNVWEWCWDWYGRHAYQRGTMVDPTGPPSGARRVTRGAACDQPEARARVAARSGERPTRRHKLLGFRVVRTYG